MIVKRIAPLSLGKLLGILSFLASLIVGVFRTVFPWLAGEATTPDPPAPPNWSSGVPGIVILPLFCLVIGFLGGVLLAGLYNVVAARLGGLEIDVEKEWQ